MSYKSSHALHCWQGDIGAEEITGFLEGEFGEYPGGDATWYDVLNRYRTDWKDRDEHMRALSLNWPWAVFALDIQGEDEPEVIREYHLGGGSYQTHPRMPDFDPDQLRRPDGEPVDLDYGDEPMPAWHPRGSILRDNGLQSIWNLAAWNLAGDASLSHEELDGLAPSLKKTIMALVWERETPACRHIRDEVETIARESVLLLPEEEAGSIARRTLELADPEAVKKAREMVRRLTDENEKPRA